MKGKTGTGKEVAINMPDGIILDLTRECGGDGHSCHIINVMSGSFEKEIEWGNPHSGGYGNYHNYPAKNAANSEARSISLSDYRYGNVLHTRNN
jgi:hypothetical protein